MSGPLKQGDKVYATYNGRTVPAVVTLASPNGRSLVIAFEAMLGGHVGMMPIFQLNDGTYRSLLENEPVELERLQ